MWEGCWFNSTHGQFVRLRINLIFVVKMVLRGKRILGISVGYSEPSELISEVLPLFFIFLNIYLVWSKIYS